MAFGLRSIQSRSLWRLHMHAHHLLPSPLAARSHARAMRRSAASSARACVRSRRRSRVSTSRPRGGAASTPRARARGASTRRRVAGRRVRSPTSHLDSPASASVARRGSPVPRAAARWGRAARRSARAHGAARLSRRRRAASRAAQASFVLYFRFGIWIVCSYMC